MLRALLSLLLVATPLGAADVVLSTQDGLELTLDGATGAVTRVKIDGADDSDRLTQGAGLYVRDRRHMADVPPSAVNVVPNPSFEVDADSSNFPDGWIFDDSYANGAGVAWVGGAFAGNRAIQIQDKAGGTMYYPDVPVTPGTRYYVQCMSRGTARTIIYVVWKTSAGEFIYYEGGHAHAATAAYTPVDLMTTAPFTAFLADVYVRMIDDGDVTLDMVRMYAAPPQVWSNLAAPVVTTPTGARQTGSVAALGLDFEATYTTAADRIDLEVVLRDTLREDRALDAGMLLPVLPSQFWDAPNTVRAITQQDGGEQFAYTWWGRMYNDGPWGNQMSVYPFAALTLFSGKGLVMGYDVTKGPQDVRFFHSTYIGESFTSLFHLGLAPEPGGFPREARFRLQVYRVDGGRAFRSALDRIYRWSGGAFDSRVPEVGGWTPWRSAQSIPAAADYGLKFHTWDDDVAGDAAASVATLGRMNNFDYWLPLTDFAAEPTLAEARTRLDFNATQSGDPQLQADARSIKVSGLHDAPGREQMIVYNAPWLGGSGWTAVCGANPDPEVRDLGGSNWTSRYGLMKADLDARFQRAQAAGTPLDGAFMDWFLSSLGDRYNQRRTHWTTSDGSLSYDPESLMPAIPEGFSHWDAASAVSSEMRGRGLLTMARDIHFPSFWASPLLDLFGREVEWQSYPEDDEVLSFYRAVAGKKPYLLLHNADWSALDPRALLNPALLYGLISAPNWDRAQDAYYWDVPGYVARDRALFRKYVALYRLQARAGWEPLTEVSSDRADVKVERWGSRSRGMLLLSAYNQGAAEQVVTFSVDLQALGLAAGDVRRVVELVEKGVVPASAAGSTLRIGDRLAAGAARLYHLHLKDPAATPVVLKAVKQGADVGLTWSGAARTDPYEVLLGADRTLAGAGVELVTPPAHTDAGVVLTAPSRYYGVE